jgi:anti-anti-sigma factor
MKTAMQPTLTLVLHDTPRGLVAQLRGDAGVAAVDELEKLLLPLAARRPPLLVLDMSGLEFISSLAMGTLVAFQRGLKRHRSQLVLAAVSPVIRQALRYAMLEPMFSFSDSVEDALDASTVYLEGLEA